MTSGTFALIDPRTITIDRTGRQRSEVNRDKVRELAESFRQIGIINPPTVDRDHNLIAGEHRVLAALEAGFLEVPVQYIEDLSSEERHLIELEENIRRTELSWQDRVRATAEYHKMKATLEPSWSQAATARSLGMSEGGLVSYLQVAQELSDDRVASQEKLSTAVNVTRRILDRRKHEGKKDVVSSIEDVFSEPATPETDAGSGSEPRPAPKPEVILNEDFKIWGPKYSGEPFNFIHCDFPYGIATGSKKGQSAAKHLGQYDDSAGLYFELINTLAMSMDNLVDPSAHMMFWFSMTYYHETKEALESMGWTVQKRPFIWAKSDNTGILPDPNRGPRWIYETAFFCTRNDRKIVKAVGDAFWGPTTKRFHTSEKSFDMLRHFFKMLVDENTSMLDPTCGSGMSVRAARAAGASRFLGLELDKNFYEGAKMNLEEEDVAL